VTANINCRIFPGHKPADIMAELAKVAGDPAITWKDVTVGSVANDASPLRADFINAATKAIRGIYPGIPIIPTQASGASDCQWFRYYKTPCYGASPTMIKESDEFAHGLNERMPVANINPAITYYLSLFSDLSK
jgi:carboxypeptidase PM20D1